MRADVALVDSNTLIGIVGQEIAARTSDPWFMAATFLGSPPVSRSAATHQGEHVVHHGNGGGSNQDDEDTWEDEQHEREDEFYSRF